MTPKRLRVLAAPSRANPFMRSPDGRAIGFPDGDRIAVVTLEHRAWRELPLAAGALEVALHPALDRTAVATTDAIAILDAAGRVLVRRALPAGVAVTALAFDPPGARLWAGLREGRGQVVALLDAASLAETGRAPVDGKGCAEDAFRILPGDPVAVEAACGQDGAWVTFVRAGAGGAVERVGGIAGENDPFAFAGLAESKPRPFRGHASEPRDTLPE